MVMMVTIAVAVDDDDAYVVADDAHAAFQTLAEYCAESYLHKHTEPCARGKRDSQKLKLLFVSIETSVFVTHKTKDVQFNMCIGHTSSKPGQFNAQTRHIPHNTCAQLNFSVSCIYSINQSL